MMTIESKTLSPPTVHARDLRKKCPYTCSSTPGVYVFTGDCYIRFAENGAIDVWNKENFMSAYNNGHNRFIPLNKVSIVFTS